MRHRNYRLYFFGMLVSVIGTWGQSAAQAWFVYELTASPLTLGLVAAAPAIPVWLLSPWAGVVIDRVPRRRLLVCTQAVQMVLAFVLATLAFTHTVQVWHIVLLAALLGASNAFDAPTRQAFVIEMVGREDMPNAIALNSAMFSAGRLVGPAIGGMLMVAFGPAWTFFVNGVSFLAIIGSLLAMALPQQTIRASNRAPLADLAQGLRFIRQDKTIVTLISLAFFIGLLGMWSVTLLPVIAREVLDVQGVGYSALLAAVGLGSLISTLLIAYMSDQPNKGKRLTLMNLVCPMLLLAFALSRFYPLSLALLILIGLTANPQLSLVNALIQTHVPNDLRGRVMSVYTLFIFGSFPVGGLLAGALADRLGAPTAIATSALVLLTVALVVRFAGSRLHRLP